MRCHGFELEVTVAVCRAMVRTLIQEKIATVGVGYPATPLMEGRIRICLSAAHTKEQLDYALQVIEKVADELGLKYSRKPINC
jgi:serine palmitoyltransferase